MSKTKAAAKAAHMPEEKVSKVKETTVDPALASLFAKSSGPVLAPTRSAARALPVATNQPPSKPQRVSKNVEAEESESTSALSSESSESEEEVEQPESRPRKKRKLGQEDDIEATYLNKLAREEEREIAAKTKETTKPVDSDSEQVNDDDDDDSASSASNDLEDLSDVEPDSAIPQHESLGQNSAEYAKTRRTVFLGNVSIEAIKSKAARKQLEAHLKSVLDTEAKEVIESIRFRSTAFDVTAGPRKAAYAKKELMDDTTKGTNAYVVLNTESAARNVAKKLNGSIILDRHLHTDWLAHPTATDHKRCVFVGNLNFVDVESNADTNEDGSKARRSRAKEPADAEEGLWRAFSKIGAIESVRVIRDKATRVGKGFAYVQFISEVHAEQALALDGKKFPPMLPRLLRVSRAKRVLKKDLKRKRDEKESSRPKGKAGARGGREGGQKRKFDGVVFEGYRASSDRGMKFKTKGKKKGAKKPTGRSSRRGEAFRASGGKKKRDSQ